MLARPIEFYNRYTQTVETEAVYGEGFLLWAYGTCLGRLSTRALFKRAWFSYFYGWLMNRRSSQKRILPFIRRYGVVMEDFSRKPEEYETFNDFFTRELKPGIRRVDGSPNSMVFPADGRHFGFQDISKVTGIFVKGQMFDLETLLGCSRLAKQYQQGAMVISRLCPVDYHRFHFPVAGVVGDIRYVEGSLYSVNPLALRRNIRILAENRRMLTLIQTEQLGQVVMLEVGATCVGSIVQNSTSGDVVERGQEKGLFRFGGSTTIVLIEPGRIHLAEDLVEQSAQGRELYAKMGDVLGEEVV